MSVGTASCQATNCGAVRRAVTQQVSNNIIQHVDRSLPWLQSCDVTVRAACSTVSMFTRLSGWHHDKDSCYRVSRHIQLLLDC